MIALNEKPDIYGNNKMFSKLVFLSDNGEIEFQSHEMVKIAEELLSTAAREFISIPNYQTEEDYLDNAFESFDSSIMRQYAAHYKQAPDTFKSELESFKAPSPLNFPTLKNYGPRPTNSLTSKEISDEILLPASVKAIDTLGKWLFLADSFHKKYEDSELKGWWLTIDNRLILLRNLLKDKSHLYVSDHGFTEDVKKEIKSNLLQFDDVWQNLMPYFHEFSKFYTKLSPEEKGHVKDHFVVKIDEKYGGDLLRNCSLLYKLGLPKDMRNYALKGGEVGPNAIGAKIEESDPEIEPVEPDALSNIEPTAREDYELIYKSTLETVLYIGKSNITFVQKVIQISPLLTQIERIFHQEDARYYNNFFTLTAMAKNHTKGLQEFLIRPLHSFGLRDKGESYRGFADAIQKCSNAFTDSELANKMRTILKGGTINDERLYFLANLVAAWFVSEPARYTKTILSNLILLDFLESNAKDHNGNVLYTFQNVLIHPNKPPETLTEVKINNLYGDTIDLAFFDGVHPMAHRDSVLHGRRTLGNEQKLSSTHQKEGHLLIHWLDQKISKDIKKYVVVARPQEDSTEEQKCCLLDPKPSYDDIKTLLNAKEKPSQKIKKDPILNKKWEILYDFIIPLLKERLTSLEKLL